MKTLKQIQNQKITTKINKLNKFIRNNAKKPYKADETDVKRVCNLAYEDLGCSYLEPESEEKGFKIYRLDVELLRSWESKTGELCFRYVYIAEKYDEENSTCDTFFYFE